MPRPEEDPGPAPRPAAAGEPPVAVIGAGIAGLACARVLQDAGRTVTLFDKGRVPGGRACSRRRGGSQFDHGAQYFTVKDPRFRRAVEGWLGKGVVAAWGPRLAAVEGGGVTIKDDAPPLYVGVPAMNALPAHLAAGLDVRNGRRVTELKRAAGGWELRFDRGGPAGGFGAVLVTAPAPQTAALLDGLTPLAGAARRAVHRACWAALVVYKADVNVPFDAAFLNDDELPNGAPNPLAWAAREASKPGRPAAPAWTLHAKPEWSDAHVDRDPAAVLPELVAAFAALVKDATGVTRPTPVHAEAYRWRYAHVETPALKDGAGECLFDPAAGLGAAGDWCVGGRVEGAFLSGVALAGRAPGGSGPVS